MSSKSSNASGGIGFCSLLGLLFIALKLCGVISWSWLWVLCPLWAGIGIIVVMIFLFFIFVLIFGK